MCRVTLVYVYTQSQVSELCYCCHTQTYYLCLTRVRSGFWNRMIHLSLSSLCSSPTSNILAFLSSSDTIYFSVWIAHMRLCMDSVPSACCLDWHDCCNTPGPSTCRLANRSTDSILQVQTQIPLQRGFDLYEVTYRCYEQWSCMTNGKPEACWGGALWV